MKIITYVIAILTAAIIAWCLWLIGYQNETIITNRAYFEGRIQSLEMIIDEQQKIIENRQKIYDSFADRISVQPVTNEPEIIAEDPIPNRGVSSMDEPLIMRVTAYDLSYQSCRKYPDHPEYGITASGAQVKEWYTVAAGKDIPFGTRVYVPYFNDQVNNGIFVVQDRGSSIKENCLDVYMADYDACMGFGVRELEVYILED